MSNKIKCFYEDGRPKCRYYSIVRYGKLCSFDGTWYPCKTECPHFVPLGDLEDALGYVIEATQKSCHKCIWRNYVGNLMVCDNATIRGLIQAGKPVVTPCEFFDLDRTGEEYLIRITEGYSWVREERRLRS